MCVSDSLEIRKMMRERDLVYNSFPLGQLGLGLLVIVPDEGALRNVSKRTNVRDEWHRLPPPPRVNVTVHLSRRLTVRFICLPTLPDSRNRNRDYSTSNFPHRKEERNYGGRSRSRSGLLSDDRLVVRAAHTPQNADASIGHNKRHKTAPLHIFNMNANSVVIVAALAVVLGGIASSEAKSCASVSW